MRGYIRRTWRGFDYGLKTPAGGRLRFGTERSIYAARQAWDAYLRALSPRDAEWLTHH